METHDRQERDHPRHDGPCIDVTNDRPERDSHVVSLKKHQQIYRRGNQREGCTCGSAGRTELLDEGNAQDWVNDRKKNGAVHIELRPADTGSNLTCRAPEYICGISNRENADKKCGLLEAGSEP